MPQVFLSLQEKICLLTRDSSHDSNSSIHYRSWTSSPPSTERGSTFLDITSRVELPQFIANIFKCSSLVFWQDPRVTTLTTSIFLTCTTPGRRQTDYKIAPIDWHLGETIRLCKKTFHKFIFYDDRYRRSKYTVFYYKSKNRSKENVIIEIRKKYVPSNKGWGKLVCIVIVLYLISLSSKKWFLRHSI